MTITSSFTLGALFILNDGFLDIITELNFNGEIDLELTVTDGTDSATQNLNITVNAVNDAPVWIDIPNQIVDEDCVDCVGFPLDLNIYVSDVDGDVLTITPSDVTGAIFTIEAGILSVELEQHFNGVIDLEIAATDIEFFITKNLNINVLPINDPPSFLINNIDSIDEDSGNYLSVDIIEILPGGGTGDYMEVGQQATLFFNVSAADPSLFAIQPEVSISGQLSFLLEDNMNGNSNIIIELVDQEGASYSDSLSVQINQVNDTPNEFITYSNLEGYQNDESTFIIIDDKIYFRYPYQSGYIENQLAKKLTFKWQWKSYMDVDLDPIINKNLLIDNVFYQLQLVNINDPEDIIILADTLAHNPSNYDMSQSSYNADYEVDEYFEIVSIDIDLSLSKYDTLGLDLRGKTEYKWAVIANNYQNDSYGNDPEFKAVDEVYSFIPDLELPSLEILYLHDDIFEEFFDLYMPANEEFFDLVNPTRPLKLWVYYDSLYNAQPEILFPSKLETENLNNIYYIAHDFKYSGNVKFIYQMRDQAQNINEGSHNVGYGVIDPLFQSSNSFFNNVLSIEVPYGSIENKVSYLVTDEGNSYIGDLLLLSNRYKFRTDNILLNKLGILSFDLDLLIDGTMNMNNLGIYKLEDDEWVLCETYTQNNFLKTKIDSFSEYAVFFDFNNQTLLIPNDYFISQNYPNPFNPSTSIDYALVSDTRIEIAIYNIYGNKIKTLFNGYQESGFHTIYWDGKNENGLQLSSGIYLINLNVNNKVLSKKMVKIK